MPKRKRDKYEDSEYDYLNKKLKKLQRKIRRGRRRHSDTSSSSDSDNVLPRNQQGELFIFYLGIITYAYMNLTARRK